MYLAPLNYDRYFKKVFSDPAIAKAFLQDFLGVTIESLEMLPKERLLTDDAIYVEFDFRCKIEDSYVIVDMQQWFKPDIVQRFYLYHALNTGLQLEVLPKEAVTFAGLKRLKATKDYRDLEPVITLIWMVDDTLGFHENYVSYVMTPELVLEFLRKDQLWQEPELKALLQERERLLLLTENKQKHLDFLPKNRLIFAFQRNIVNNTQAAPYDRWFRFAEKTKNAANAPADFSEFEHDEIFAEIMRRLDRQALPAEDDEYMEYERDVRAQISRWEQNIYEDAMEEGREIGFEIGKEKGMKEGIKEGMKEGMKEGEKKGREEALSHMILAMARKGKTAEQIADMTDLPVEEIRRILAA